jgi:glycine cleavage system regulatory protein
MNAAVAHNTEPFTDPRRATPAEQLAVAQHQADGARLRMRAAVHDMEAAKVNLLRGDDDALPALNAAVREYRAQYGIRLAAMEEVARLRRAVRA